MLVVLWAVKVYTTWAAWGDLTIDSGHEMYVPWMLAEGKMLYRDVWFLYTPGAPYINSCLFRLFGMHLNVLYWAGSLSALGSAIFLYLIGMRLSSWLVGWTAGAVILLEAFQPSLFCFPLPYAFAAVYGCLVGCLFLWLVINASTSTGWPWMLAAGVAAAVALLIKLEFGIACYGTLALLIATRSFLQRSWSLLTKDFIAILPGIAICALVIRWMVSIAGVEFITQENFMSWPTSYFMKVYGKAWLELTGFTVTGLAFHEAMFRAIPLAIALFVSYCVLWWNRSDMRSVLLKVVSVLAVLVYFVRDIFLNFLPPHRLEPTLSTFLVFLAPEWRRRCSRSIVSPFTDLLEPARVSNPNEYVHLGVPHLLQRAGRAFVPAAPVSDHPSSRPLAPVRVPGRISDLSRVFSAGRALHLCIRSPRQKFCSADDRTRNNPGIETFG